MELLIIPEGGEDLKVLNLQHFQCNYGQNSIVYRCRGGIGEWISSGGSISSVSWDRQFHFISTLYYQFLAVS